MLPTLQVLVLTSTAPRAFLPPPLPSSPPSSSSDHSFFCTFDTNCLTLALLCAFCFVLCVFCASCCALSIPSRANPWICSSWLPLGSLTPKTQVAPYHPAKKSTFLQIFVWGPQCLSLNCRFRCFVFWGVFKHRRKPMKTKRFGQKREKAFRKQCLSRPSIYRAQKSKNKKLR